ncbi:MAG: Hsp33 family molecular chaperone HslO [Rickettsiales bacterium]
MVIDTSAGNDNFTHFADFYQPFLIDECHVKGNFIRLGEAMHEIASRHNYPEAISKLLGEQMVLACMLSGNLEEKGSLTMQVKGSGEGPVKFTVVDINAEGHIRGYAELDEGAAKQVAKMVKTKDTPPVLQDFVGKKGYLSITVNAGRNAQQYQGIVALAGETMSDALEEYFTQSEQVAVSIKVAVDQMTEKGKPKWYASGMMIQRVPTEGGKKRSKKQLAEDEEHWNRAEILMNSVQKDELLNPQLPAQTLLLRLFNEDGVWVYEPRQLKAQCRCSRQRVEDVLSTFPKEDIEDMKMDGVISVSCQFCNKTEVFREEDIKRLLENAPEA